MRVGDKGSQGCLVDSGVELKDPWLKADCLPERRTMEFISLIYPS